MQFTSDELSILIDKYKDKIHNDHYLAMMGQLKDLKDTESKYQVAQNELVQCNEAFQDSQIQIEAQWKAHTTMTFKEKLKFLFNK